MNPFLSLARLPVSISSLSLSLSLSGLVLQATDWPRAGGPSGTGTTPESVAAESWTADGPKLAWKAKVGIGYAGTTIVGNRLYTLGNVDKSDTATLWCLEASTGKKLWTREFPSPLTPIMYDGGPNTAPVVEKGLLYVVIKPSRVLCLAATDGSTRWDVDLGKELEAELSPFGIVGAPVLTEDLAILNYGSNGTALDRATGKVRWSTGKKSASFNNPVLGTFQGTPAAVVLATNAVVGVRLKDGQEVFRHTFGSGYFCHSADPIVRGEEVFITSADEGSELLRIAPGQPPQRQWKGRQYGNFMATSILHDGHLYGLNNCDEKEGAELKCVEWATGKVKWSEKGFGKTPGSPVLTAEGKLVVVSDAGEVSVARVSPEKFELLSRFQAIGGKTWTGPSLANGRLFVRNGAGEIVCFEVNAAKRI